MVALLIHRRGLLLGAAGLLAARAARAAPSVGRVLSSDLRFAGRAGCRLRQLALPGRRARLWLQPVDGDQHPLGDPQALYRGPPVHAALAVRPGAALVAWVRAMPSPIVRMAVVSLDATGHLGGAPTSLDATAESKRGRGRPVTVIACADAQGFTIIWQQQWASAGGRPEASSFVARVAPDGRWLAPPRRLSVPWALGAVAQTGHGYHLALYFDGARPDQTRLCCVTLDERGKPQQHPWWITAPERIDEVQLAPVAGGVVAYYRGGPGGTALRSVRVTSIGQWGQAPPPAADLGRIDPRQDFALRTGDGGGLTVARSLAKTPRRGR